MPAYLLMKDVVIPYLRETNADRKRSTQEVEAGCVRRLAEFFDGWYVSYDEAVSRRTVTGAVVRQFYESRKLSGVQPITVQRELAVASRACNYAIREWNYEMPNPFAGRQISSRDRKACRPRDWHMLTPVEEAKLLLAADPLTADIISFALATGCRLSEVLGLQWHRIVGSHLHFGPDDQKSNRHGVRALNATALAVLARQPQSGEYVFQRHGRRLRRDVFFRAWDEARRRAELPKLRFHDLRKIAGQRLLQATGNIVLVQYQLGHSDLRTTQQIYTREPIDLLVEAVAKI